ncbi:S8 family serine peptidase [Clostridium tarantellae]|uniref:S8 family serine peptidase n=1 Tax=Clostridium tarantellae TaxID=39493 RepID=A0A6I1MLR3_9CLOT|nr:S8 family serine peptidase [Clostridium tarantellae]MPQ43944.1 S8 family serine peptidase [Clostridium tarantellae]
MKRKTLKKIMALAIVTSFSLNGLSVLAYENINKAVLVQGSNIDELLSNMSKEDKEFLQVSNENKIKINSKVNLKSNSLTKIIVELKSDPIIVQSAKNNKLKSDIEGNIKDEHNSFKEKISNVIENKKKDIESYNNEFEAKDIENKEKTVFKNEDEKTSLYIPEVKFGYELMQSFNGIAMEVPASMIEQLAKLDEVKAIWSDEIVKLDLPKEKEKMERKNDTDAKISPFMDNSIPTIGVDKLHNEGIKGNGVKVGVLDTGIDYNHPDLKDGYIGGYDFVDDDDDPMETTYEDWKNSGQPEFSWGSAYYTAHGTHVAGTIAGRGDEEGEVTGVAPEADIYAYRVLGPYGSGATSGIIAAVDKSVEEELDVINLSLGSSVNDPLSPLAIAINNTMLYSQTMAVVAAGNSGPDMGTLGTPGAANMALTVGSNSSYVKVDTIEGTFEEETYILNMLAGRLSDKIHDLVNKSLELEFAGLGKPEDFAGKDFVGKIALIQRGELALNDKIANAKKAGAEMAIIYNNVEGPISLYLGESEEFVPTLALSKEDGEKLKQNIVEGKALTLGENIGEIVLEGLKLSDFSSRGPVVDTMDIKPEIMAPGESIKSTIPGYLNDKEATNPDYKKAYGRMSGTSMATPHVAGLAALLVAEMPDYYGPEEFKSIIMNTADSLNGDYSVYEVGAGTIDAYEAVKSEVKFVVPTTTYNEDLDGNMDEISVPAADIAFGRKEKDKDHSATINLYNRSNKDKIFKISYEYTTPIGEEKVNGDEEGVVITLPEEISILGALEENDSFRNFIMKINVPNSAASGTYEGYIKFVNKDDEKEEYQIPFSIDVRGQFVDIKDNMNEIIAIGENHPFSDPYPGLYPQFKVSDKFESFDFLVKDGETNEYIGYLGSLDPEYVPTNVFVGLPQPIAYNGFYHPILKDIDETLRIDNDVYYKFDDKRYLLELRAVANDGQILRDEQQFFVDATSPDMILSEDSSERIYEINTDDLDDNYIHWISGKITDPDVEYMSKYNAKTTNKDNILFAYEESLGRPLQGVFLPDENGEFKFGATVEELNEKETLLVNYYAMDASSNGGYKVNQGLTGFVKEGTPYVSVLADKEFNYVGDSVTATVSLNNVENFRESNFKFEYFYEDFGGSLYEVEEVVPTKELQAFLDNNDITANIKTEDGLYGFGTEIVKVDFNLEGNSSIGITGDMPLLDIKLKVVGDKISLGHDSIIKVGNMDGFNGLLRNLEYKTVDGSTNTIKVFNVAKSATHQKTTEIFGVIYPQGVMENEDSITMTKTLTEMGAEIYAINSNGDKVNAELNTLHDLGLIENYIVRIPAVDGDYKLIANIPGHLDTIFTDRFSYNYNGEIDGTTKHIQFQAKAGDVNDDAIIDAVDAMLIARAIGKENVPKLKGIQRDINFNDLIGRDDLDWVVKHFGSTNYEITKAPKIVTEIDGMKLEDIISNIGALQDSKGPDISLNVEDGNSYDNEVAITVDSSDIVYSEHVLYINGQPVNESISKSTEYIINEPGKYEVKVVAMDDLGNNSEKVANIEVKGKGEEVLAPQIKIYGVIDGKIYDEPVKPEIVTEKGTTNVITLNGSEYKVESKEEGDKVIHYGEEISKIAHHELKVVSTNEAGKSTTKVVNFKLEKDDDGDTEEPGPGEPNDGPTIKIEGIKEGKTYYNPVKPEIILEKGTTNVITLNGSEYNVKVKEENDKVIYYGEEISKIADHELKVVSTDSEGESTTMIVKFTLAKKSGSLPNTGGVAAITFAIAGILSVGTGILIVKKKKNN